jgi:hypothetical protein
VLYNAKILLITVLEDKITEQSEMEIDCKRRKKIEYPYVNYIMVEEK